MIVVDKHALELVVEGQAGMTGAEDRESHTEALQ